MIDVTAVQTHATAPDTEQDVGRFVVAEMEKMGIPHVAKDHEARIDFGEKKYGQRLRTNNGRDTWLDLAQELLDSCSYSAQLNLESKDDGSLFHLLASTTALIEGYWKEKVDSYQELQLWESLLETVNVIVKEKRRNSQGLSIGKNLPVSGQGMRS